eukprot:TRINITY_DN3123_c0_g1_i1.p1 TRINITY_DN3123_c0_g1~~TRINITY_DN3123_c0_g1_i1.p1  ORF type:complete len:101 (+),score=18.58 TRINITY_DN3123_c0_g1_i1:269-571(+)
MSVTTPSREALRLYRAILRLSNKFTNVDQNGVPWRETLRRSARTEFEEARFENDPEIIARLVMVGRDSLMQVEEGIYRKQLELLDDQKKPPPPKRSPYLE